MQLVIAGFGLDAWGQVAAIILALYLFLSIILGLVLVAALMFGFAWVHEKADLLKKLRPFVNELNSGFSASKHGDPLPQEVAENKVMEVVTQVPKKTSELPATASNIEQKIEQGSERVASAVIEFRARTAMIKTLTKAFFLPGATRSQRTVREEPTPMLKPGRSPVDSEELSKSPVYEDRIPIV